MISPLVLVIIVVLVVVIVVLLLYIYNKNYVELVQGKISDKYINPYVYTTLTRSEFPVEGKNNTLYVDRTTNTTYTWNGSTYVVLQTETAEFPEDDFALSTVGLKLNYADPTCIITNDDYEIISINDMSINKLPIEYTDFVGDSLNIYRNSLALTTKSMLFSSDAQPINTADDFILAYVWSRASGDTTSGIHHFHKLDDVDSFELSGNYGSGNYTIAYNGEIFTVSDAYVIGTSNHITVLTKSGNTLTLRQDGVELASETLAESANYTLENMQLYGTTGGVLVTWYATIYLNVYDPKVLSAIEQKYMIAYDI